MRKTDLHEVIRALKSESDRRNIEGMKRFGISTKGTLGVSIPKIREIAKEIGKDHALALELWDSGIHEAKILASIIDDPELVTEKQLEKWVMMVDSWDVCDCVCSNLFDKTRFAKAKAFEWAVREEEYVRRAGFVLMACLSVHDKGMKDSEFVPFLKEIEKGCTDERNFVRKAVNWALRQIGKRNLRLNKLAISTCNKIAVKDSKSARWIASDALRELSSNAVQSRLKWRESKSR